MRTSQSIAALVFLGVCSVGRAVFAIPQPAAPAGFWVPSATSDSTYIINNGWQVYNNDTLTAHTIVSGVPVSLREFASPGPYQAQFYVWSNGNPVACWVDVTDLTTHGTVETSASTSSGVTGYITFPVNFYLTPANVDSDVSVVSMRCSMPPKNSNGISFLLAEMFLF